MEERLRRFQEHFSLIRKSTGWTAAALGEKLGVSRQMISGLETGRTKMTIMQYRAIRQVLDEEIAQHPAETRILQDLLMTLVDYPEQFSEADRKKVIDDANMIVPSIGTPAVSREKTSQAWDSMLAGATVSALASLLIPAVGATAAIIAHSVGKARARKKQHLDSVQKEASDNDDKA